jgi:hypothetical protein
VVKCRFISVLVLVFTWTAIPALACLPNATMTQAEMACCKRMAGDCHMGAGQHSCCKTKAGQASPVAALDRNSVQIHPHVVATLLDVKLLPELRLDRARSSDLQGLPPPAPPGLNSVLRI